MKTTFALPLIISILMGVSAHAAGENCSKLFERSATPNTVADALHSILKTPGNSEDAAESKRIDQKLAVFIENLISDLPAERKARVLKAIKNAKISVPKKLQKVGSVTFNSKKMYLNFPSLNSEHPLLRSVISHEITHFIRFDELGDVSSKETFNYVTWLLRERPLGIYIEEARAFSNQYDFIRSIYSLDDLERLSKRYPSNDLTPLKDSLLKDGILTEELEVQLDTLTDSTPNLSEYSYDDLHIEKAQTPVQKQTVDKYLEVQRNFIFTTQVKQILVLSKKDFVLSKLTKYRRKQRDAFFKASLSRQSYDEWKALNLQITNFLKSSK